MSRFVEVLQAHQGLLDHASFREQARAWRGDELSESDVTLSGLQR